MSARLPVLGLCFVVFAAGMAWAAAEPVTKATAAKTALPAPLVFPDEATIPAGPMGDAVRYGRQILTDTQTHAKEYVGNGLNCTSCHLAGGTTPFAAPWVGIWGVFPEYRPRNAKVNALQDRVNDCFERSMNGKPLPWNGEKMNAILAYMHWLSQGVPTGVNVAGRGFQRLTPERRPDAAKGKALYAEKCVTCHGVDGQGQTTPEGGYLFPALWGPKSFNVGAGMARLNTAAAFVHANMPLGQGGTLSVQDSYDIAEYFTKQPRPDWARKGQDWPKGDKPKDARY